MFTSVGVLKDKSSFSRILEDNFEVLVLVLALRIEPLALALALRVDSLALRLVSLTASLVTHLYYVYFSARTGVNRISQLISEKELL